MAIKNLRERHGLSQINLANILNVTQGAVSQWESGQSKPRADVLIKLSRILDCSIDELLGIEKNTHLEDERFGEG